MANDKELKDGLKPVDDEEGGGEGKTNVAGGAGGPKQPKSPGRLAEIVGSIGRGARKLVLPAAVILAVGTGSYFAGRGCDGCASGTTGDGPDAVATDVLDAADDAGGIDNGKPAPESEIDKAYKAVEESGKAVDEATKAMRVKVKNIVDFRKELRKEGLAR